ncbi:abortive infection protein [Clostridia bacterium]|nr:abortive infection protein [Clostridia bacterium]
MNTSKQLNDQIKNIAKRTGVNAQILQKRYFMECFLERLSSSQYNRRFIIKGGMLIAALVGYSARSTMDIDITIKNLPLQKETIEAVIREIAAVDLADNVLFSFTKTENIREESEYDCFRVTLDVAFDKIRESIKIDITTGDVITPGEVRFGFCTMLEKKTIPLYSYNLETVLAEKMETILARGILNTRMRDYYDCCILEKIYAQSIDKTVFRAALRATSQKRDSAVIFTELSKILDKIKVSKVLLGLWKRYTGNYQYAQGITFEEVIASVERLATFI